MMSLDRIIEAQKLISSFVKKTPIVTSSTLNSIVGRNIILKCENFQKTGSFKARGALNAVLRLKATKPNLDGVVTHSSGNHGQALAWAAKTAGYHCSVVIPNNTAKVKIDAIENYGAKLIFCEPTPQARESTCKEVAEKMGYEIIPPFDNYDVISGQGTIAAELIGQVPQLDAILVPVSGGGMISGIAIAAKGLKPNIKVYAVEPMGKELEPCLKSKKRLWSNPPRFLDTIADGIRFQQVGHLTFPIMCDLLEEQVFTVSDNEMIEAMKFSMQRLKLVIEVSSAAGIAAVLSSQLAALPSSIQNVAVILCGGNVDLDQLPWVNQS